MTRQGEIRDASLWPDFCGQREIPAWRPRDKPGGTILHLAKLEGSVDDRVQQGVGQPEDGEVVEDIRVNDPLLGEERGEDKQDVVRRPADDGGQHDHNGHAQRLPFRLAQQVTAHGSA